MPSSEVNSLAVQALNLARGRCLVNLRFIESAAGMLRVIPFSKPGFFCDGEAFLYHPDTVLEVFSHEESYLARTYLHSLLHCLFLHPFPEVDVRPHLWDLACDIAVEARIDELGLDSLSTRQSEVASADLRRLEKRLGFLNAEKVYDYLQELDRRGDEYQSLQGRFVYDNHELWYKVLGPKKKQEASAARSAGSAATQAAQDTQGGTKTDQQQTRKQAAEKSSQALSDTVEKEKPEHAYEAQGPRYADTVGLDRSKQRWKNAAYQMGVELESFARLWGTEGAGLVQMLKKASRDTVDYQEFLRKFAQQNEEIKVNDQEFDYIYYCYGLSLYEKLPLIEPLEYVEERRVRDFVIALDTSASTKDELIQKFVDKTYSILSTEGAFAGEMNIYIVQCDAEVSDVALIKTRSDFERYLDHLEVKGLGGTDFRPVFELVERLRDEEKITNLAGLIYFTDGQGTYPSERPDYEVAFVFVEDDFAEFLVPVWAYKVVLGKDEIKRLS